MLKKSITIFSILGITACGSVQNISQGNTNITPDENAISTYLFATDFASSGQILSSDQKAEAITNTGISGLGSSAIIRSFNNLIYVLHDGFSIASYDNVQVIDLQQNFKTIKQFSTGVGTNPHDISVVGNKAFITLYSPESSAEALNNEGKPTDLLVMDLTDGSTIKGISFESFLNHDANLNARADQMVLNGSKLYVCLQDLDGPAFTHNAPGKIAVVDINTLSVDQVITLKGRNPVDVVTANNTLFVAEQAPYDFGLGNFDTSTSFGGLEIVPLDGSDSILLPDEELGGYIERLAVAKNSVFTVVSQFDATSFLFTSEIIEVPFTASEVAETSEFISNSSDVREIAANSQNQLWISRREIKSGDGSASNPQVDVFNAQTGEQIGTSLVPPVPVTSIVFGN